MRVVICDDQSLFAQALAVVLRSCGHEVVACVNSPTQAVAAVASGDVDVCVMDLHFPGGSGIDGVTGVVAVAPNTRVVVLTGSSDAEELTRAVHAGAQGLAVKGDDIERVVDTLERVHEGEIVLKVPQRPNSLLRAPDAPMERNPLTRFLTAREREVLERLVRGESTSDLAVAMGVRYSTARTHIQNLLTKLGVHSKLEAVAFAVSNQVVEVNRPETAKSSA
ncbi:MAG: response regulator transcription factor [Actinomycetota bacterium]|nr:response regulator transcription factor [Actinomycetota bacterium]